MTHGTRPKDLNNIGSVYASQGRLEEGLSPTRRP